MNKHILWICCVLGLITAQVSANAQTVTGLYEAAVPVKGRDNETKNEGMQRALTQVLIKLSGNHQKFMQPEVQAQLVNAYRWVQYFKFKTRPRDFQTVLTARFDREAVEQVLSDLQLPMWSAERPNFLGLVVLDQNQQKIINEEQKPKIANLLKQQAQERGLPILWPLLDLEDFHLFNAKDITTFQQSALLKAAQRYGASAVLVGYVNTETNNTWQGSWQVYFNDQKDNWQSEATPDVNALLTRALNASVDKIAEFILTKKTAKPIAPTTTTNFTPPESADQFELQVIEVRDLNSYASVVSYLRSLEIIETINVKYMDAQLVVFDVLVKGGNFALAQFIQQEGVLLPHNSGGQEPVYRWVK